MKRLLLLAVLAAAPGFAWADEDADDEAEAIAQRYGMNHLERIDALKFTFNVRRGTATVSRSWTWNAADGAVSVETTEGGRPLKHAYAPARLAEGNAALNEKVDRWFVNDRYWLLFPHHLATDRGVDLAYDANEPFPIPPGTGDRLTATYGDDVGYTPGDVYEVFYDVDHVVRQWVFRKGGASKPTLAATWDDHARLGPLLVSLRHKSPDGAFELWFTGVEARFRGSNAWTRPVPGT